MQVDSCQNVKMEGAVKRCASKEDMRLCLPKRGTKQSSER